MNYKFKSSLIKTTNMLTLFASFSILVMLSFEIIFEDIYYLSDFSKWLQFGICMVFMLDYFVRLHYSPKRWHFFFRNILLLVVSIPYLSIYQTFDISLDRHIDMIIRAMPLIRGFYGIYLLAQSVVKKPVYGLFITYILVLLSVVYYSSLLFYIVERTINPMVTRYWDSLWWALMTVTTVGSNIYGSTFIGQILAVLLAMTGMMMFPIFTVYITTLLSHTKRKSPFTETKK